MGATTWQAAVWLWGTVAAQLDAGPVIPPPLPRVMWVDVQSVYVRATPGKNAARVGLLVHGDRVEVVGCQPACDAPGAWALLSPRGAVPWRVLHALPLTPLAQAQGADAFMVHATALWAAPVLVAPDEHAQVVDHLKGGYSYAWRDQPALLEDGFLERVGGGFVALQHVRLAAPSGARGVHAPAPGVVALPRGLPQPDGGPVPSDVAWPVEALEKNRVKVADGWVPRDKVRLAMVRPPPRGLAADAKWIHVDLREQVLTAYEGTTPVFMTLVSTGTSEHPTPRGRFTVLQKMLHSTMEGEHHDYLVEEVPHVMPLTGDVALHGAFWHQAFGAPVSHGCINLPPRAAQWLFEWVTPALPPGWHAVMPGPGDVVVTVVVEHAAAPVLAPR